MFGLDTSTTALLLVCLLAACSFEFVNGFHDTANAVATVIYTNTLKPWIAVLWSGAWNFLGVFAGGIGVAMGIVNLLPVETLVDQNMAHSLAMVGALLLTAIFWNLLTWALGLPCSSSHTLIGSILGVGLAYALLTGSSGEAVNWGKAKEIGISLLISPLFGFTITIVLMYFIRVATRKTHSGETLFMEPHKKDPPPWWIRGILLTTCTLVSFFHGSNDGQKGIGLMMLILIGIVPAYFALDSNFDPRALPPSLNKIERIAFTIDTTVLSKSEVEELAVAKRMTTQLKVSFASIASMSTVAKEQRFIIRKEIILIDHNLSDLIKKTDLRLSEIDKTQLKAELKKIRGVTDYSPRWVILLISVSLGLGTTIGWKRIVMTVGEKIGKEHLTYAQGASAELVAAITIGLSSSFNWPVSTTHVLSSGIAGSMVANKGIKNLQPDTVRNIVIAWCLTLPVVMVMSGSLFLLFRALS